MSSATKIEQMLKQYPEYYLHQSGILSKIILEYLGKCLCFTCDCMQNCTCHYKKLLLRFIPNYSTQYKQQFNDKLSHLKVTLIFCAYSGD